MKRNKLTNTTMLSSRERMMKNQIHHSPGGLVGGAIISVPLQSLLLLLILSAVLTIDASTSPLTSSSSSMKPSNPTIIAPLKPKAKLMSSKRRPSKNNNNSNDNQPLLNSEIETLRSLGMSNSEIETLLGNTIENNDNENDDDDYYVGNTDMDNMGIEMDQDEYDDDEYELYDDIDDDIIDINEETINGVTENEEAFLDEDENENDNQNEINTNDNNEWWKDPFANFGDTNDNDENDITLKNDNQVESLFVDETNIQYNGNDDEEEEDINDNDDDENENILDDLIIDDLDDDGEVESTKQQEQNEVPEATTVEEEEVEMELYNIAETNLQNEIENNMDTTTTEEILFEEEREEEEDEYDEEYYDEEEEEEEEDVIEDVDEETPSSLSSTSSSTTTKNTKSKSLLPILPSRSTSSVSSTTQSKSISTIAIPTIIIPKLGKQLISSPSLTVPIVAAITVGNIVLHRISLFLKKKKEMYGNNDDEYIDENDENAFYDADELVFTEDDDVFVENVRLVNGDDDDDNYDFDGEYNEPTTDGKKKRFGFWGQRRNKAKSNKVNTPSNVIVEKTTASSNIREDPTKDSSDDTPSSQKSIKRGLSNLFNFNNLQMKQELEEQYIEIDSLRERSTQAEAARDKLESDYDEVLQRLKDAQKQLMDVSRTNNYLKNELRDNKNVLERAISAERQKTNAELARVRDQMVDVLERERRIMRAQLLKSSQEVRSMISHRDDGRAGDDDDDFVDYEGYDYDPGDDI